MIFTLDYFFILLGLMLSIIAVMSFLDRANPRRLTTGSFWALYAVVYLAGEHLPPALVGIIVIVMAIIAGFGGVAMGKYGELSAQERQSSAQKLGNRLFIPALIIPVATMIGSVVFKNVKIGDLFLLDQKNFTLIGRAHV